MKLLWPQFHVRSESICNQRDMSLTGAAASVEKSFPEKESDVLRVLLTIELQNAMVALEAKQPDTSIGKLFFCIFAPQS